MFSWSYCVTTAQVRAKTYPATLRSSHSAQSCRTPVLRIGMWSLWELEAGKNVIRAGWRYSGWASHCLQLLCQFLLGPAQGKVKPGTAQWKSGSGHPLWPQLCQLGKEEWSTWSPWPWVNLLNREQFSLNKKRRAAHFTWSLTQHTQFVIKTIMKVSMRNLVCLFHSSNYLSVCLYHFLMIATHLLWKFLIATFLPIYSVNKYIKCQLCSRGHTLDPEEIAVDKRDKNLCLHGTYILLCVWG